MATPKKGMKTTTAPAPTAMAKKPVATPKTMVGVARSTPTVAPRKAVALTKTPVTPVIGVGSRRPAVTVGTPRPGADKARAVATPVTQRVKAALAEKQAVAKQKDLMKKYFK